MGHAKILARSVFAFGLAAFVFGWCGLVSQSEATSIVTLTHDNSSAQINTTSLDGMFNWTVDGQNQLGLQWFWYRVGGSGPESPINTISAPTILQLSPRQVFLTYANSQFSIEVDYLLTGSTPGSRQADISESITIANTSCSPLIFHFFQYSDFDLGCSMTDDTVTLQRNEFGLINQVNQRDATMTLSETVVTPGANHGQGGLWPDPLSSLNDCIPTTLTDNLGPTGPGDATWALQWDFVIPVGQSVLISKDKRIDLVPEPSTVGLVSLGLIALGLQKRRRSV